MFLHAAAAAAATAAVGAPAAVEQVIYSQLHLASGEARDVETALTMPAPQAAAPESQAAAPESQVAAPESQVAAPESQAAAPESQAAAPESQAAAPESQAAPASQPPRGSKTMRCSTCERELDATAFSNAQRKRKGHRRCQRCVEGQHEIASPAERGLEALSLADPPMSRGTCRICLADDSITKLVAPCQCRGSSRFVHPQCHIACQQRGHLNECEVCFATWTMGLDAAAVPPTAERVREIVGACEQAVLLDDASLLRRRLSPYIYFSHGSMLVELAAQHGKRVALRALLDFATVRAKLCMLRPRSVAGSARRQRTPCAV